MSQHSTGMDPDVLAGKLAALEKLNDVLVSADSDGDEDDESDDLGMELG